MKKLVNLFLTIVLLLALGSCTKENSFQNFFNNSTNTSFAPLNNSGCGDAVVTVEVFRHYVASIDPNMVRVRITYDAGSSLSGPVTIRKNSYFAPGTLITTGSLSQNSNGTYYVEFFLNSGNTYYSLFYSDNSSNTIPGCLITKKIIIPPLYAIPVCTTCEPM